MKTDRLVLIFTFLNFVGLATLSLLYFLNGEKIVYVDSTKIINGYLGMQDARKDYQQKLAVWRGNVDTLVNEIQLELVNYEKVSNRMTVREKELAEKLLETKKQQLANYQKAISEKAGQEDAEATNKVISEINNYIEAYGKENNYTIVLAATQYGNIAYAKEHLDITDKIIEGLNKNYMRAK